MKIILLTGLGNPGKKFEKTRHNAGFLFVDYFWKEFRDKFEFSDWEFKKSLNAEISIGKDKSKKIILLKPQTFMNLSGEAVKKALIFYKINLENLIIAHDDIDLLLEKYKISKDSSSAGHNGVQNIIEQLGTKDFARIRIGIENRPALREDRDKRIPTEKYVLGRFTAAEEKTVNKILEEISDEI